MRAAVPTAVPAAIAALALLVSPLRAEDAPPPAPGTAVVVRLVDAVKRGLAVVRAKASGTYSRLVVEVESRSASEEEIDFGGESFEPQDGSSCQRLGLGPVVAAVVLPDGAEPAAEAKPAAEPIHRNAVGDGSARVRIPAGRTVRVELTTCCLDLRRSVPRAQTMVLAKRPLAPKLEALFRRWADHPDTPQDVVNSAVWQGAWDADLRPIAEAAREARKRKREDPPAGPFVRSFGGDVHVLLGGALRVVDRDGNERFLGTGISSFAPEAEGVWVTAAGFDDRIRLWRVPMTAEETIRPLCELKEDVDLRRVLPFAGGTAVVFPGESIHVARSGESEGLLDEVASVTSCTQDENGRLVLVSEGGASGAGAGRYVVHVVDGPGRKPLERFRLMNVRHVRATPAGVFSLSEDGELERVRLTDGRRMPLDAGKRARWIVGASPNVLWIEVEGGAAGVEYEACDAKTGRALRRASPRQGTDDPAPVCDPVTGDLVWVEKGAVLRVRPDAASGGPETVWTRPEPGR